MAGTMDQVKGQLKEAGGALTRNNRLKREGKADQAAQKLVDTVKDAVTKTKACKS